MTHALIGEIYSNDICRNRIYCLNSNSSHTGTHMIADWITWDNVVILGALIDAIQTESVQFELWEWIF